MRSLTKGLVLTTSLLACTTDARSSSGDPENGGGAAGEVMANTAGATPHRALSGNAGPYDERTDIGRGVLHLTVRADSVVRMREDTMIVHAAPTVEAPVVARWIHRYGLDWTWEYRLESSEPGLVRNDVEWSYEESGLPVDSTVAGGEWARVIFAVTANGEPRHGWVRVTPAMNTERWVDVLADQSLFFRNADSLAFHAEPDGQRVWLSIAGRNSSGPDYTMTPLERQDEWLRVIFTTPSDYCVDVPVVRKDTVWIRYLDPRGRPRVWYCPRGC